MTVRLLSLSFARAEVGCRFRRLVRNSLGGPRVHRGLRRVSGHFGGLVAGFLGLLPREKRFRASDEALLLPVRHHAVVWEMVKAARPSPEYGDFSFRSCWASKQCMRNFLSGSQTLFKEWKVRRTDLQY